jgi:hypothetical protein
MKTTNGGAVSVDTKEKKSGTTIVWPNPAIDEIHLRGQFNLQPIKLDIFNSVGLLVKELELGSGSEKLNISDLGAGFYVVRIRSAQGEQETVRFVKY